MGGRRAHLAALIAALALPAVVGGQSAWAQTPVPHPDSDPFYAQPSGLAAHPEGTLLASRKVEVTAGGLPIPADAWQLAYRSNDTQGRPIQAIATLLVPRTAYAGKRPLVSYQVAIDSLGSACNPSYTLRTGRQKELVAILPLIALGWAVVVPDFEGPRHAYTAGMVAARTVLDGIRAASRFAPAGLAGRDTPVGLWGYSGGGQASAWAAEQQPSYAPELNIKGVAAGGVPPDVEQVARAIDGGPFFGIYLAASVGLNREYPDMRIEELLNAAGKAAVDKVSDQCAEELVLGYPFQRMRDLVTVPDPLAVPRFREVIEAVKLGKATPTAPLFIYHTVLDELIPVAGPDALVRKYCRAGARVFYQRDLLGEHVAYAVPGGALAVSWLIGRFAGQKLQTNCSIKPDPAAKPPAGEPAAGAGSCVRGRAITVRPRRRRGERIRGLVATVARKRVASRRGSDLRSIRIRGLRPGERTIRLRVRGTRGTRVETVRRRVRC